MSAGRTIFQLGFEISPIIFTDGIATEITGGGMLPIVAITEAANFLDGLLSGGDALNPDDFFAHFRPIPGATLIDNEIGSYPFANQTVAANAIIADPLRISLRMDCPARGPLGYVAKLATIMALQAAVARHSALGGTYTVATPSFIWTNCILTGLRDVSSGDDIQVQTAWQWDFVQPLITLNQAQGAQASLMSKITNGLPTDGSLSGPASTVGFQNSLAGSVVIPAGSTLTGMNAAAPALGAGS